MILHPKGWNDFQHYKDRAPTWIKLHKSLLDDYEFQCLPVASKALAPMLWLLASEYENGTIDATAEKIAFRLRMSEPDFQVALKPLLTAGFFALASKPLASRKRDASLEKRTSNKRREQETREETSSLRSDVCSEPQAAAEPESVEPEFLSPVFIAIETNKRGETYSVRAAEIVDYAALYPGVDVPQQLRAMAGWSRANAERRKTKKGMPAFINGWLAREQNRGSTHGRTNGHARQSAHAKAVEGFGLWLDSEAERDRGNPDEALAALPPPRPHA